MLSQQKADGDLLKLFGNMVAILLLLSVLGVLGTRYFSTLDNISAQGLRLEHSRLLNVLNMIKAQWLAEGRPKQMMLDWDAYVSIHGGTSANQEASDRHLVNINESGWPMPDKLNSAGCERLWYHLLGTKPEAQQILSSVGREGATCDYFARNNDHIRYHLTSGRVILLTNE